MLKELGVALNYTQELLIFALILARTMPMVVLTPFFGGKIAPPEIKMGLGVLFSIILWPLARGAITAPIPITPFAFLILMMKEVFIGFCIGFVNSHIFTIMEMAGRMVDTARGSSMAEVMVPHSGARATPFGDLYYQMLLVVFVAIGGHAIFLDAFFFSFASIPLNVSFPLDARIANFVDYMIRLTGDVFLSAALLAAPVLAAVLITDVVFGILNRVAPQLNAYFMSMPVKAMGGVLLVLVILDAFLTRLNHYVVWGLGAMENTINLLTP